MATRRGSVSFSDPVSARFAVGKNLAPPALRHVPRLGATLRWHGAQENLQSVDVY